MGNRLFLAGKPQIGSLLGNSLDGINPQIRRIVYGEVMISDLVSLTWRFEPVFENGNDFSVTRVAAELLMLRNAAQLQAAQEALRRMPPYHARATVGDVIVILPLAQNCSYAELQYDNPRQCWRYLVNEPVTVVYVGESLPADVATVLKHVQWKKFSAVVDDLASLVRKQGAVKVSIFDALRFGLCAEGVEDFQRRNFPGRLEVEARELIPHLDIGYVKRLLRHHLKLPASADISTENAARNALASIEQLLQVGSYSAPRDGYNRKRYL